MTLEQAHQEFFDNVFHNSMNPHISDEAKALAMVAIGEKIERENPKPIAYKNLKKFFRRPIFIVDGNVRCWTILVSVNDDFAHFLESEDCGVRLMSEGYCITWFAYEHEPKGYENENL